MPGLTRICLVSPPLQSNNEGVGSCRLRFCRQGTDVDMEFWKLSVVDNSWDSGRLTFDQKSILNVSRAGQGFQVAGETDDWLRHDSYQKSNPQKRVARSETIRCRLARSSEVRTFWCGLSPNTCC